MSFYIFYITKVESFVEKQNLVNETLLWNGGKYITTIVVVQNTYLGC